MSKIVGGTVTRRVVMEYTFEFGKDDLAFVTSLIGSGAAEVKEYLTGWAYDLGEVHADSITTLSESNKVNLVRKAR